MAGNFYKDLIQKGVKGVEIDPKGILANELKLGGVDPKGMITKEIKGAGGITWVEYRKGMYVQKNSLDAYSAAKERRDMSKAYLAQLQREGVRLPKLP